MKFDKNISEIRLFLRIKLAQTIEIRLLHHNKDILRAFPSPSSEKQNVFFIF